MDDFKDIRVKLYKATPLKLRLASELEDKLTHAFNGVETTSISFKEGALKLGGLSVKMVEIDPREIGCVLVHWYPNFNISTTTDPFCTVFMLTPREIRKLINIIENL